MRSIAIWDYIVFGTSVRYLQDARAGAPIYGAGLIYANISRFLERLDDLELVVTKRASKKLIEIADELEAIPEGEKLTAEQASAISKSMSDIRNTLMAESTGFEAYLATDKRYAIEKLTSNIWSLFHPDVGSMIPVIAKIDFEESGKLIVFERPTAAAFHLMRGIEDVLKLYYCKKKRSNRSALMWGPMTSSLRAMKRPPPEELLDHLDHVRRSFRNPTQHPEKVYDMQEVQDLLSLSIDIVNRMIIDL